MSFQVPLFRMEPAHDDGLGFEIVRIETMPAIARAAGSQRDNHYVAFLVTGGSGNYLIDFHPHSINTAMILFVTRGQVHGWHTERNITGFALQFNVDFIHHAHDGFLRRLLFFHQSGWPPCVTLDETQATVMKALCEELYYEFRHQEDERQTVIEALVRVFLIKGQRWYSKQHLSGDAASRITRDFLKLLDEHFGAFHRVSDYAVLIGVSPDYLTEVCQETLGQSAGELIRKRLVLQAKRLLAHSDESVNQIGATLEFADSSYFARFFKRETGSTPSEFRDDFRAEFHVRSG